MSSAILQHSKTSIQNIVIIGKGWISMMVATLRYTTSATHRKQPVRPLLANTHIYN